MRGNKDFSGLNFGLGNGSLEVKFHGDKTYENHCFDDCLFQLTGARFTLKNCTFRRAVIRAKNLPFCVLYQCDFTDAEIIWDTADTISTFDCNFTGARIDPGSLRVLSLHDGVYTEMSVVVPSFEFTKDLRDWLDPTTKGPRSLPHKAVKEILHPEPDGEEAKVILQELSALAGKCGIRILQDPSA